MKPMSVKLKRNLVISSFVMLIFCINYILSAGYVKYVGFYPLGIISGITFSAQIILLVLTVLSEADAELRWRKLLVIVLEIGFILFNGYFLFIYYLVVRLM